MPKFDLKLETTITIDTSDFEPETVEDYMKQVVEEAEDRSIEDLSFEEWHSIIELMLGEDIECVVDLNAEVSENDFIITQHK